MFKELVKALQTGVESSLCNNNFAKGLLHFLITQSNIPNKDQLCAIDSTSKIPSENTSIITPSNIERDNRFYRLDVKGIRKFPSDKFYSIFFHKKHSHISSIFLGDNGSGKSSLYSALEYASLGHSYIAEERSYKSDEQQVAYMYHNNDDNDSRIILHFNENRRIEIAVGEQIKKIVTPACFCSEYDIQEISREGLTPAYICTQLGLNQFLDILNLMKKLKLDYESIIETFHDEQSRIEQLQRRVQIMYALVTATDKQIKTYESYIDELVPVINKSVSCDIIQHLLKRLKGYIDISQKHMADSSCMIYAEIESTIANIEKCITENQFDDINISEVLPDIPGFLSVWKKEITAILSRQYGELHKRRRHYIQEISKNEHELNILLDKIEKLKTNIPLLRREDRDITEFNEALYYLEQAYKGILTKQVEVIAKVLPQIFNRFLYEDISNISVQLSEPISINNDINDKEIQQYSIKVLIQPRNPITGITEDIHDDPRRFLNTFRFKMFCFLLKFAITCGMKKLYNVNLPFIVDDVFDASDFTHRTSVGELISTLYDAHDNIEGLSDLPLQLIFFTQDNLIADTITRELLYRKIDVKFSRIFDYYDADDNDIISPTQTHIKIEDIIR